jgi:hypothetical protein
LRGERSICWSSHCKISSNLSCCWKGGDCLKNSRVASKDNDQVSALWSYCWEGDNQGRLRYCSSKFKDISKICINNWITSTDIDKISCCLNNCVERSLYWQDNNKISSNLGYYSKINLHWSISIGR